MGGTVNQPNPGLMTRPISVSCLVTSVVFVASIGVVENGGIRLGVPDSSILHGGFPGRPQTSTVGGDPVVVVVVVPLGPFVTVVLLSFQVYDDPL